MDILPRIPGANFEEKSNERQEILGKCKNSTALMGLSPEL